MLRNALAYLGNVRLQIVAYENDYQTFMSASQSIPKGAGQGSQFFSVDYRNTDFGKGLLRSDIVWADFCGEPTIKHAGQFVETAIGSRLAYVTHSLKFRNSHLYPRDLSTLDNGLSLEERTQQLVSFYQDVFGANSKLIFQHQYISDRATSMVTLGWAMEKTDKVSPYNFNAHIGLRQWPVAVSLEGARTIIELRTKDKKSSSEIATILQTNPNQVAGHIAKAVRQGAIPRS